MSTYSLSHDGRRIVPLLHGFSMTPAEAKQRAEEMERDAAVIRALLPQAEANLRAYEANLRAEVEAAVAKGATAHGLAAFRINVGRGGRRFWVRVAGDLRAPPPPLVNFGRVHDGRTAHVVTGNDGQALCGEAGAYQIAMPGKHKPCGRCWRVVKDRGIELPPVAEGAP